MVVIREGLLFELLFADDVIPMTQTKKLEKLRVWKKNMEAKGFKVNIGKTKVMQCEMRKIRLRRFECGRAEAEVEEISHGTSV